ncbi:hypothetical protein Dimus_016769 [Dionaea muscipula]
MGSETNSPSSSGKRTREPEDEVYLDNLHSHKRYLSEIMACSLNGLTVGDSIPETIMESPVRSDSIFYLRDDISYSPMSEDLDDSRYYETCTASQPESLATSPVSPHIYKPLGAFSSSPPRASQPSSGSSTGYPFPSSQPRQRGSDTEGRFPSSPSDICHSADLRRAALLRSVQMRAHPVGPSAFESPFASGQEAMHTEDQAEERVPCSFMKPMGDDQDYQSDVSEPEFEEEKPCTGFNIEKREESTDQENGNGDGALADNNFPQLSAAHFPSFCRLYLTKKKNKRERERVGQCTF